MIPSVKTLTERLDIEKNTAKRLRWIMEQTTRDKIIDRYPTLDMSGYSRQRVAMEAIDSELETFGVEFIVTHDHQTAAMFANAGGTYDQTVLYDVDKGRFIVTSYGDWIESEEKKGRHFP